LGQLGVGPLEKMVGGGGGCGDGGGGGGLQSENITPKPSSTLPIYWKRS